MQDKKKVYLTEQERIDHFTTNVDVMRLFEYVF